MRTNVQRTFNERSTNQNQIQNQNQRSDPDPDVQIGDGTKIRASSVVCDRSSQDLPAQKPPGCG